MLKFEQNNQIAEILRVWLSSSNGCGIAMQFSDKNDIVDKTVNCDVP